MSIETELKEMLKDSVKKLLMWILNFLQLLLKRQK